MNYYLPGLKKKTNILVCPLDWGIGHATRCVPVINELLKQNTNVIIGADNRPLAFLKQEFPHLQFIKFPGYKFSYPLKGSMALKMALSVPNILLEIKKENKTLDKLINEFNIDAVISDNRFGLYSKKVPCVFITHQIMIKTSSGLKFLEPVLYRINKSFISKYSECWIPDFADELNLSGDLSHKKPLPPNSFYVGPLSRFGNSFSENENPQNRKEFKNDFFVILSGPEPQRTILEKKILVELQNSKLEGVIVSGKPEKAEQININKNIKIHSHLATDKFKQLLIDSDVIISRPGYSTIMDLVALGKKAVFIPTPGQTEQEYLADYFFEKKVYFKMDQDKFELNEAIKNSKNFKGIRLNYDNSILKFRVDNLISLIKN